MLTPSKRDRQFYWFGVIFGTLQFPIALLLATKAGTPPWFGGLIAYVVLGFGGFKAASWALGKAEDSGQADQQG